MPRWARRLGARKRCALNSQRRKQRRHESCQGHAPKKPGGFPPAFFPLFFKFSGAALCSPMWEWVFVPEVKIGNGGTNTI